MSGELEEGASRVVVIGSDSPTIDSTIVVSAFLCLQGRDLVLGPATDGGVYLVGARGSVPPIFGSIDWDSPQCPLPVGRPAQGHRAVTVSSTAVVQN